MNGFLVSLPAASVGFFAARAALALILGAAVGLERQWRQPGPAAAGPARRPAPGHRRHRDPDHLPVPRRDPRRRRGPHPHPAGPRTDPRRLHPALRAEPRLEQWHRPGRDRNRPRGPAATRPPGARKDHVMNIRANGKDQDLSLGTRVVLPALANAGTENRTRAFPFLGSPVRKPTHRPAAEEWQPHRVQGDRSTEWWSLTATVCDPVGTRYFLSWTVTHPGRRHFGGPVKLTYSPTSGNCRPRWSPSSSQDRACTPVHLLEAAGWGGTWDRGWVAVPGQPRTSSQMRAPGRPT
jgi:hypothetical protein